MSIDRMNEQHILVCLMGAPLGNRPAAHQTPGSTHVSKRWRQKG